MITLQYCDGFFHTSVWISHRYTCVPFILNHPPNLPPYPVPLGCHRTPFAYICESVSLLHWHFFVLFFPIPQISDIIQCISMTYVPKHCTLYVHLWCWNGSILYFFLWLSNLSLYTKATCSFICWWTLRWLPYLGNCNDAAMNEGLLVSFWMSERFFLDVYIGVKLLSHIVILLFICWETFRLFSHSRSN